MFVDLYPHQETAVNNMHNGCVLYGQVGVGKTRTSLYYYFTKVCKGVVGDAGSMRAPRDVVVITTAKVRDSKAFELQAAQFGIHEDRTISVGNTSITVDSWNNIKNYTEVTDAFFIFDEQRVVGYGAWSRAFIKIAKSNEFIMLSATPGDTWLDYIPLFIANGWYRNKTDFLDQHVIWTPRVKYPKVLRYQNVSALVRRRNEVLVHMPYERHTTRHPVYVECGHDEDLFEKAVKKRWHVFENRPLRDVGELFSVMRKIVNSDSSRLDHLRSLMEKHPKLIVFYNFDYELEMLRTLTKDLSSSPDQMHGSVSEAWDYLLSPEGLAANQSIPFDCQGHWTKDSGKGESFLTCAQWTAAEKTSRSSSSKSLASHSKTGNGDGSTATSSFAIAEWNGHKHEEIPADSASWVYLVQYRAGAEGWNCVETDAMVFYSLTYSYRDWWQAHGRIDRLNTPFTDLYYYHLISKSPIDKAIRAAQKVKKNFNERNLVL